MRGDKTLLFQTGSTSLDGTEKVAEKKYSLPLLEGVAWSF
jgi:hypothetical protein